MVWNRNYLKFGLDVDDTLLWCNGYAIQKLNEARGLHLKEEDLTIWGLTGTDLDLRIPYFDDPEFVREQPLLPGAREFVQELSKRGEVFFVTAVPPEVVSVRVMRLRELFPEVPQENTLIGTRKDVVAGLDVLLDDKARNILDSPVKYPILMRKPWNEDMSGILSVNSYDEFLSFIDNVLFIRENPLDKPGNKVIAFIGPSAGGKTTLLDEIVHMGYAVRNVSYTTRDRRPDESEDAYHFVSKEEFARLEREGIFLETTRYADRSYGSPLSTIREGLRENNVVLILDICGAIALKKEFPDAVIAYVDRKRADMIRSLVERAADGRLTVDETSKRILSFEQEKKNKSISDVVIDNTEDLNKAVEQFRSIFCR